MIGTDVFSPVGDPSAAVILWTASGESQIHQQPGLAFLSLSQTSGYALAVQGNGSGYPVVGYDAIDDVLTPPFKGTVGPVYTTTGGAGSSPY